MTTSWALIVDLERRVFVCCGSHRLGPWPRSVVFSFLYFAISCGLAIAAEFIPCVDWASAGFATFYRQPKFSPGGVLFFAAAVFIGYYFNTLVVNGPGIGICLERWKGKSTVIFLYATAIYFLGGIFVLNGSCGADGSRSVGQRIGDTIVNRAVAFSLPLALGLHWTWMDSIPGMGDIVLNYEWIRRWGRRQWTAVAIGLGVGLSAAAYDFYLLYTINRLQWYVLALVCVVAACALVTYALSGRYRLHLHHYAFAALSVFFPVRESPFSTVAQAIFIGVGLDGLCRWGPDPLFYPLSNEELEAIARDKAQRAAAKASNAASANAPLLVGSPQAGSSAPTVVVNPALVAASGGAVVLSDGHQIAEAAVVVRSTIPATTEQ